MEKPFDIKSLEGVLIYDETSKSCLRWKHNNKEAGTLDSYGYWVIRFKGKGYKAHRVILSLHKVEVDGYLADHIDGNRSNNLFTNLRVVTQKLNTRNAKKNKLNTSGKTGVGICNMKQHTYWYASWYTDRLHYKRFNVVKYGEQEARRLAVEYRERKIQELNSIGYFYSERHGK